MSSVYNTEPPVNGKVVLKTTIGDVDMELWPKEAPKAVRNFLQLCMEGYYDGCEFFRVIPDLFAQTGDPTNTGDGGESIYGAPFADEFHSRLRFTRRGIVAMANNSEERNSNTSQFFITLKDCEWLNKKHTIFGRITGDTIYNVLAFNDLELEGEVPEHAPRILGVEIMHNPFDDIVPRAAKIKEQPKEDAKKKKKNKKLAKKNTSLLSFGAEQDDEDQELDQAMKDGSVSGGVKSAHDLLEDETLQKEAADEVVNSKNKDKILEREEEQARQEQARRKLRNLASSAAASTGAESESDDEGGRKLKPTDAGSALSFDERMRQKLAERQAKAAAVAAAAKATDPPEKELTEQEKIDELKKKMGFKSKKGQRAVRRSGMSAKETGKRKAAEEFMSPLEVQRQKYKRTMAVKSGARQQDTLAKLAAFKSSFKKTVKAAPAKTAGVAKEAGKVDWTGIEQLPAEARGLEGDADLLDEDKDAAGLFAAASAGLTFVKTLEEKRAEIHRDDNYKTHDPLKDGSGETVDLRRSQHKRRLEAGPQKGARDVAKW